MKAFRWFEKALLAILSLGVTAVIAACYGGYYVMQKLAGGKVTSGGLPVGGIEVCLSSKSDAASVEADLVGCATTDEVGQYDIEGPDHEANQILNYGGRVEATDKDGVTNGQYETKVVDFGPQAAPVTVDIELTKVAEEPAGE
ncbi:MAG: hypothetical protein HY897_17055 [Deltaproteobacteria bacterium]|nr:hypothetical protein [Deltaproteobacteria bacterium]